MTPRRLAALAATTGILVLAASFTSAAAPRPRNLPGANLRDPIIWGAEATNPDGFALAFGGCHRDADDGRPHTRIKQNGEWVSIVKELRAANPLQKLHGRVWVVRNEVKEAIARVRRIFFQGQPAEQQKAALAAGPAMVLRKAGLELQMLIAELRDLHRMKVDDRTLADGDVTTDDIAKLMNAQIALEQVAELLEAEPAGRALSPILWHPATKRFYLFGGDHLDYLTNDLWTFDPAKKRWQQLHPPTAPPPRGLHKLEATEDGKIRLTGGYTYFNDIWYMGGPYLDLNDGAWVYDPKTNIWTSEDGKELAATGTRTYRKKQFHPLTYLKGERPDAAANEKRLAALPANQWVAMDPPHKPRMNRDWGSACIDTARDVMLRFSGGHCAHSGSDVITYHFATNRWELPFPVEFPLGQTYSNTSYPTGFNLNRRPWVSGHTYKNFGYDPTTKTMLFTGHNPWSYIYDPGVGDWIGRVRKPKAMSYNSSFYTLTLATSADTVYAWGGQYGRGIGMCKWRPTEKKWTPLKVTGAKLPGPQVDHSGLVYDSKRDRLLLFPKKYTDTLWAMDCKTNVLSTITPTAGSDAAKGVSFWRELAYVPEADWVVVIGSTLPPPEEGGARPTLAYDCAKNAWLRLKIPGPNPAGKGGRNVSQGAMYDPKRKLIWATDTNSQVYALRLDAESVGRIAE